MEAATVLNGDTAKKVDPEEKDPHGDQAANDCRAIHQAETAVLAAVEDVISALDTKSESSQDEKEAGESTDAERKEEAVVLDDDILAHGKEGDAEKIMSNIEPSHEPKEASKGSLNQVDDKVVEQVEKQDTTENSSEKPRESSTDQQTQIEEANDEKETAAEAEVADDTLEKEVTVVEKDHLSAESNVTQPEATSSEPNAEEVLPEKDLEIVVESDAVPDQTNVQLEEKATVITGEEQVTNPKQEELTPSQVLDDEVAVIDIVAEIDTENPVKPEPVVSNNTQGHTDEPGIATQTEEVNDTTEVVQPEEEVSSAAKTPPPHQVPADEKTTEIETATDAAVEQDKPEEEAIKMDEATIEQDATEVTAIVDTIKQVEPEPIKSDPVTVPVEADQEATKIEPVPEDTTEPMEPDQEATKVDPLPEDTTEPAMEPETTKTDPLPEDSTEQVEPDQDVIETVAEDTAEHIKPEQEVIDLLPPPPVEATFEEPPKELESPDELPETEVKLVENVEMKAETITETSVEMNENTISSEPDLCQENEPETESTMMLEQDNDLVVDCSMPQSEDAQPLKEEETEIVVITSAPNTDDVVSIGPPYVSMVAHAIHPSLVVEPNMIPKVEEIPNLNTEPTPPQKSPLESIVAVDSVKEAVATEEKSESALPAAEEVSEAKAEPVAADDSVDPPSKNIDESKSVIKDDQAPKPPARTKGAGHKAELSVDSKVSDDCNVGAAAQTENPVAAAGGRVTQPAAAAHTACAAAAAPPPQQQQPMGLLGYIKSFFSFKSSKK